MSCKSKCEPPPSPRCEPMKCETKCEKTLQCMPAADNQLMNCGNIQCDTGRCDPNSPWSCDTGYPQKLAATPDAAKPSEPPGVCSKPPQKSLFFLPTNEQPADTTKTSSPAPKPTACPPPVSEPFVPYKGPVTWKKILETDSHGESVCGKKIDLIKAALSGARVKVIVPSWANGAYSSELNNVSIKADNLWGQALMHVGKNGWDRFAKDAYRWFLMISTTGNVQITRYEVETKVFKGETSSRVDILWFVRTEKLSHLFSHFDEGSRIEGIKEDMTKAVKNCYDLRVVNRSDGYCCPLHNLEATENGEVSGQNIWNLSQCLNGMCLSFMPNAYWQFTLFSSTGFRDTTSWTVGLHENRCHIHDTVALDWFVDSGWEYAFTNNDDGSTMKGTLCYLREKITSGHRVKVMMGTTYTIEADNLQTFGENVAAQCLNRISKCTADTFQEDAYWSWQVINTTGMVSTHRYNIGDATNRGSTCEKRTVSWYVDTAKWVKVLSVDKCGKVLCGSKMSLREAILLGASVRLAIELVEGEGWYVTGADSVEFGPADETMAQCVRSVNKEPTGKCGYRIKEEPTWWYIIVNTRGLIDISRWKVGIHANVSHCSINANVNWFVSY